MLNLNCVPCVLKSSFQNLLKNNGSRSEIIVFGMPCKRQISTEKRLARSSAVNLDGNAMKWTYFVNLSQMTHITVWPNEFGKWVMKSMVSSSHTWDGMGSACKSPNFFCV